MDRAAKIGNALRQLQWTRGLRAGLAVAGAMIVCHAFNQSIGWAAGWAALGGFEAILVDNGGPYRTRFATIATLMLAGTVACVAGAAAAGSGGSASVLVSLGVTAGFCFVVTFARVIAQPIGSTSVIILVIYFVALGSPAHTLAQALWNALAFVLGGVWAAVLSLVLWPVDPFRPARLAIASCYATLAEFSSTIAPTERGSEAREVARRRAFEWQRLMRSRMETARAALSSTAARAATRTHRARNLTVLLETADMLLAITMRTTELALAVQVNGDDSEGLSVDEDPVRRLAGWLSEAEFWIARGLQRRPGEVQIADAARCLSAGTAESGGAGRRMEQWGRQRGPGLAHLGAAGIDAAQNIEIAGEAVKAVWSGVEATSGTSRLNAAVSSAMQGKSSPSGWAEAVRANWTLDSVMMRHALRMLVVGGVDVLVLRALHLSHGYWLGMTSIIVLQPYQSNTFKRGVERVGGTIAGGVVAALLAAAIASQSGIILAVTTTSVLTLATYAVDYGWYCFFLTPTFVLMGLPHLGDWKYSGVRILTTFLGAAVAVGAMRLLWPEREHLALTKLLGRSAAADAAYLRAMLGFWRQPTSDVAREREILAPARRSCGLASNDAEESLDRLKLETGFGRMAQAGSANSPALLIEEHALTFVTYIRRLTQSITTLAVVGKATPDVVVRIDRLAGRLEAMSGALLEGGMYAFADVEKETGEDDSDIAVHQLQRMERQVSVLERAMAGVTGNRSAAGDEGSRVASVSVAR